MISPRVRAFLVIASLLLPTGSFGFAAGILPSELRRSFGEGGSDRAGHPRFLDEANTTGDENDVVVHDIGNIRPEGIHALSATDALELGLEEKSSYVLVTEIMNGGVNLFDTETLEYTNIIPSAGFQVRSGLGVYYAFGHIIVCSLGPLIPGNPFEIYIYDPAKPDEPIATCTDPDVEAGSFNDLDIVGESAYVTDSAYNRLWSFNVPAAIEAKGCDDLSFVTLDEEVFNGNDETPVRSNGTCFNAI